MSIHVHICGSQGPTKALCRVGTNRKRVWAHVYSEREVEQRAWEVYGGPDGLQKQ